MAKKLSTYQLLSQKNKTPVQLPEGVLSEAIGRTAERRGLWLIYGSEKNGKSWFAINLAKQLAQHERVDYISAEEGVETSFQEACLRAGITASDKIGWREYLSIDEIIAEYRKPKKANIIFIDNLTIYADELKPGEVKNKLQKSLPDKLLILLAHEERKEAYPAIARMAKKMAKVVVNIKGLTAFVTSRFAKGGVLQIDEDKSELFWGNLTND